MQNETTTNEAHHDEDVAAVDFKPDHASDSEIELKVDAPVQHHENLGQDVPSVALAAEADQVTHDHEAVHAAMASGPEDSFEAPAQQEHNFSDVPSSVEPVPEPPQLAQKSESVQSIRDETEHGSHQGPAEIHEDVVPVHADVHAPSTHHDHAAETQHHIVHARDEGADEVQGTESAPLHEGHSIHEAFEEAADHSKEQLPAGESSPQPTSDINQTDGFLEIAADTHEEPTREAKQHVASFDQLSEVHDMHDTERSDVAVSQHAHKDLITAAEEPVAPAHEIPERAPHVLDREDCHVAAPEHTRDETAGEANEHADPSAQNQEGVIVYNAEERDVAVPEHGHDESVVKVEEHLAPNGQIPEALNVHEAEERDVAVPEYTHDEPVVENEEHVAFADQVPEALNVHDAEERIVAVSELAHDEPVVEVEEHVALNDQAPEALNVHHAEGRDVAVPELPHDESVVEVEEHVALDDQAPEALNVHYAEERDVAVPGHAHDETFGEVEEHVALDGQAPEALNVHHAEEHDVAVPEHAHDEPVGEAEEHEEEEREIAVLEHAYNEPIVEAEKRNTSIDQIPEGHHVLNEEDRDVAAAEHAQEIVAAEINHSTEPLSEQKSQIQEEFGHQENSESSSEPIPTVAETQAHGHMFQEQATPTENVQPYAYTVPVRALETEPFLESETATFTPSEAQIDPVAAAESASSSPFEHIEASAISPFPASSEEDFQQVNAVDVPLEKPAAISAENGAHRDTASHDSFEVIDNPNSNGVTSDSEERSVDPEVASASYLNEHTLVSAADVREDKEAELSEPNLKVSENSPGDIYVEKSVPNFDVNDEAAQSLPEREERLVKHIIDPIPEVEAGEAVTIHQEFVADDNENVETVAQPEGQERDIDSQAHTTQQSSEGIQSHKDDIAEKPHESTASAETVVHAEEAVAPQQEQYEVPFSPTTEIESDREVAPSLRDGQVEDYHHQVVESKPIHDDVPAHDTSALAYEVSAEHTVSSSVDDPEPHVHNTDLEDDFTITKEPASEHLDFFPASAAHVSGDDLETNVGVASGHDEHLEENHSAVALAQTFTGEPEIIERGASVEDSEIPTISGMTTPEKEHEPVFISENDSEQEPITVTEQDGHDDLSHANLVDAIAHLTIADEHHDENAAVVSDHPSESTLEARPVAVEVTTLANSSDETYNEEIVEIEHPVSEASISLEDLREEKLVGTDSAILEVEDMKQSDPVMMEDAHVTPEALQNHASKESSTIEQVGPSFAQERAVAAGEENIPQTDAPGHHMENAVEQNPAGEVEMPVVQEVSAAVTDVPEESLAPSEPLIDTADESSPTHELAPKVIAESPEIEDLTTAMDHLEIAKEVAPIPEAEVPVVAEKNSERNVAETSEAPSRDSPSPESVDESKVDAAAARFETVHPTPPQTPPPSRIRALGASMFGANRVSRSFERLISAAQSPAASPMSRTAAHGDVRPMSAITSPVFKTNPILDELLYSIQLITENDPTLTELDMSDCPVLTNGHGSAIANALLKNTHLKSLSLKGCHLQTQNAEEIAEALRRNTTVEVLDLSNNAIGPAGIKAIAEMLHDNATLKDLRLHQQRGPAGYEAEYTLSRSLTNNTVLTSLRLQIRDVASRNVIDNCISRNKDSARKARLAAAEQES
ncbi:hypothetical protein HKX48_009251 [Thoreauomyces humboldtii]|nr:hypothetical protein HKX48_009251 [Thoreauomyces humboldtii]